MPNPFSTKCHAVPPRMTPINTSIIRSSSIIFFCQQSAVSDFFFFVAAAIRRDVNFSLSMTSCEKTQPNFVDRVLLIGSYFSLVPWLHFARQNSFLKLHVPKRFLTDTNNSFYQTQTDSFCWWDTHTRRNSNQTILITLLHDWWMTKIFAQKFLRSVLRPSSC